MIAFPARDLELATYLSSRHDRTEHHLSASECETMAVADLVALADDQDRARWETLGLGYTEPAGACWLREAIAGGYRSLSADQIMCFAGAQEALYAVLHALLSPGDHSVVVLPSYQSMETLPLAIGAVSAVALDEHDGWSLDVAAVAAAIRPNTRIVAISFPNNPTGKLLERERFDALVALCRQHGIWLLSDEVYRLTERDPARRLPAAADSYERGVSLGAMSKAYGLPGLRIGWVACHDTGLVERLATMRQYLSTCSAGPSEVLAAIALRAAPTIIGRNRRIVEANLAMLLPFLARHADLFDCREPEGGMVCYPRYRGAEGVGAFVDRMAASGVLLLPAPVFRSELMALPTDRFRIGFGRRSFASGLAAMEDALAA